MPKVNIRRGGIDTQLNAKRAAFLELIGEFFLGKHLSGATDELGQGVIVTHARGCKRSRATISSVGLSFFLPLPRTNSSQFSQ